jgi:tetratricopeptide (TPR) repeat protein
MAFRALREYQADIYVGESDNANSAQLYARAREMANRAIALNPENGYAQFFLGTNEFLLNHYQESINEFVRSEKYMPHLANVLRLLGQSYFYLQQYPQAVAVLDRYFLMNPFPKVTPEYMLRVHSVALYRNREYGRASIRFVDAENYNQHRVELLQLRVVNALLLNQVTMADYLYRRFRFKNPQDRIIPSEILARSLEGAKLRSSTRFFETMRMRGDADASTLKVLALAYSKVDRYIDAISVLRQALQSTPKDPELYLMLGDVNYGLQHWKEAADYYVRHLELMPKSPFRKEIEQKLTEHPPEK